MKKRYFKVKPFEDRWAFGLIRQETRKSMTVKTFNIANKTNQTKNSAFL